MLGKMTAYAYSQSTLINWKLKYIYFQQSSSSDLQHIGRIYLESGPGFQTQKKIKLIIPLLFSDTSFVIFFLQISVQISVSLNWKPGSLGGLLYFLLIFLLKEISLGVHWKDWCWSWNSTTLATSCEELTHWKRPWCWEGLAAGGKGDDRGWDGCMASPTWWTWVWVDSRSWCWMGRPGMLQFIGSQRIRHDWETELTEHNVMCICLCWYGQIW